jgi:hypothetical protein
MSKAKDIEELRIQNNIMIKFINEFYDFLQLRYKKIIIYLLEQNILQGSPGKITIDETASQIIISEELKKLLNYKKLDQINNIDFHDNVLYKEPTPVASTSSQSIEENVKKLFGEPDTYSTHNNITIMTYPLEESLRLLAQMAKISDSD